MDSHGPPSRVRAAGAEFAGLRILRRLGGGGMGDVYLVENPRLGRFEALKLIRHDAAGPQLRERFEHEARVVAGLDHPSIITVYDFGIDDDVPWFTMQYLESVDLTTCGPQPAATVARILTDAAGALDYAHWRGVVHRDVKPANMATVLDADGSVARVVLLDFGIARITAHTRMTVDGAFLGSVAYAAPETLSGADADARSDQYSLACTVFELLTGRRAFEAPTAGALIHQHMSGATPQIARYRPELAAYDAVLTRALAADPARRYGSCGEFAAAWAAVDPDAQVPAHPGSPPLPRQRAAVDGPPSAGTFSPARSAGSFAPARSADQHTRHPATHGQTAPPPGAPAAEPAITGPSKASRSRRLLSAGVAAVVVVAAAIAGGLILARSGGTGDDAAAAQTTSISDLPPNKFINDAFFTNIADGKCQFQASDQRSAEAAQRTAGDRLFCYFTSEQGRREAVFHAYGAVEEGPLNSNPRLPADLLPLPDGIYRHLGWTITVGADDAGRRALIVCNRDQQCSNLIHD